MRESLNEPLKKFIKIEGKRQAIIYEGIGMLCFKCGRIDHRTETYTESGSQKYTNGTMASTEIINGETQGNPTQENTNGVSDQKPPEPASLNSNPSEEAGYGPWMLVQRKKGKKSLTARQILHQEQLRKLSLKRVSTKVAQALPKKSYIYYM